MRDPLAPVIEGVDLSGIVNRYSFQCEPFFTDRNESQTMLDGSTVHDVFPLKARFSWTLNALSAEQYAALNAALRDTVTAQIFDPTINAVRSARFHVTRPAFVYNFATSHYMSTDGGALILADAAPRTLSAVTPAPRPVAANRDPLAPVFDGYDLSGMVNRYSFQCEPFTTDGDNAGTLQDGSTVLDVLANKFRLSWTLNAISAQQYADLCAVLSSGTDPDTVSATVYHPMFNATYTAPFHVTFPVFRFALDNGQCMACADSALTLEETTPERSLVIAGGDWWTLYSNGLLDVYYEGDMPDYHFPYNRPPWDDYGMQIINAVISTSVTTIGEYAFAGDYTNMANVTISEGVTYIGAGAFSYAGLTSVAIPASIVGIYGGAFESCENLTNITIPDGILFIDGWAFARCTSLTGITLPASLDYINAGEFAYCTSLKRVTVPDSVTNFIGNNAFKGCDALTDIYYGGTEAQWNTIKIASGNEPLLNATIHYNSSGPVS